MTTIRYWLGAAIAVGTVLVLCGCSALSMSGGQTIEGRDGDFSTEEWANAFTYDGTLDTGQTVALTRSAMIFSKDGRYLAAAKMNCCDRCAILVWDVRKQILISTLTFDEDETPKSLAFSPDTRTLLLASTSSRVGPSNVAVVRLWDVGRNLCVRELDDPNRTWVSTPVFSTDGKALAIIGGSEDTCSVQFVDLASGCVIHEIEGGYDDQIAFGTNGKTIASGVGLASGPGIAIRRMSQRLAVENTLAIDCRDCRIVGLFFDGQGRLCAGLSDTKGSHNGVMVWGASHKPRPMFYPYSGGAAASSATISSLPYEELRGTSFCPARSAVMMWGAKAFEVWRLDAGSPKRLVAMRVEGDDSIGVAEISPDGSTIAALSVWSGKIHLWQNSRMYRLSGGYQNVSERLDCTCGPDFTTFSRVGRRWLRPED